METIGLYIHVPFCVQKCPYCDFYSFPPPDSSVLDRYTQSVQIALEQWSERQPDLTADTVYFGGGTPTLLGGERLSRILQKATECFHVDKTPFPEITLEANPADDLADTLRHFASVGGNRLSLGMQSAVPEELRLLGRRHTPTDVVRTVADAHRAGIDNVSLDIMLGISGQTVQSALLSAATAVELGAQHISAYMLKIEPHTAYGRQTPPLPTEDETADMYLAVMEYLEAHGYRQYEISNTALPEKESRHNIKYWNSDPYLGIGPAAASFVGGRRFTYPRDVEAFMRSQPPLSEPVTSIVTAGPTEYAMLRLRTRWGLEEIAFYHRFGQPIPPAWRQHAVSLPPRLVTVDDAGIWLTREGYLLSNTLIRQILT